MALKVHRVVVVGCPRCVLTGDTGKREGVGKSCFCNRFVRPDTFSLHHDSVFSEREWRDNSVYNKDHFIYWGAATKRLQDGTRARFQVVEQTEFYNINNGNVSFPAEEDYISRACSTHFISRGKIAYKLHNEDEYTIPSSLKHKGSMPSRATQLFPNNEFSEGKGVTGFICLFDPTLQGEDIKLQVDFLSKLIQELVKTKRNVILACTKCDEANEDRIKLGANLAATVIPKKPIPFVQTSAKEGVNIEDVFFHVVSPNKKRSFARNGKNSLAGLFPTYSEVVLSRGHNETYAMNTFNRVIKNSVQQFSTEWSDIWPLLQSNPECVQAVEVLGIEKARKVFCQRLMEIKVNEVRETHPKTRKLDQERTKNIQSELIEAFNGHPDLGSDCMYDFVYSPSPASTPKNGKSSSSDAPTPSVTPCNTPIKGSSVPDSSSGFFPKSPPPLPPTSSIPSLSMEGTPTRTALFSPTRTSQTLPLMSATKLNRSTEILACLPKIDDNIPRHSSLRYRNRTLPPLPTAEQFSPTKRLSNASLTKSQPQLDDSGSFTSSSTLDRQQRRLSSSMDCLLNDDILFEEDEVDCEVNEDASPYLQPVEIRNAMKRYCSDTERPVVSSMKLLRQRTHYPIPPDFIMDGQSYRLERSKSCRDRSNTMPSIGSNPHLNTTSKPPLPPKSLTMRTESPLLTMTILSPGGGQTSLDYPSENVNNILSDSISPNILDSHKPVDDTSSIASGPFAEIDDEQDRTSVCSIPRGEQQSSVNRTPDHPNFFATLPLRRHDLNRSLSPLPCGKEISPYITSSSTRTSPERENLYASIPADDEYLTMKAGVSLEELLSDSRKPRSTSLPTVQSVIKKLQFATRSESDANSSPARRKRGSDISVQSGKTTKSSSIVESVIEEDSPLLSLQRPSVASVDRPLPPSPTKLRRVVSNSGKHGDNNIYESIDENEEWFQQLQRERMLKRQQKMDQLAQINTDLATNCNQIMEKFLASPDVQELWLKTVKSILPDFQPPTEITIQPLTVNPEYFISYTKSHSKVPVVITDTPVDEQDYYNDENNEDDKLLLSGHRKLTVTDSVVERMNQELQQKSSSSSESEGEEEDVELDDDDEENTLESPTIDWATLLNNSAGQTDSLGSEIGRALSIIHQKFNEKYKNDDHLDINEGDDDSENENFDNNESDGEGHFTSSDDEYVEGGISDMPTLPYSSGYLTSPASSSIHTISVSPIHQIKQSSSGTPPLSATLSDNHSSSYVVQNGHLSVCQLNSLDSGISSKE